MTHGENDGSEREPLLLTIAGAGLGHRNPADPTGRSGAGPWDAVRMSSESEHILLDLSGTDDRAQAIARAAHGCPEGYTAVAKKHMVGQTALTTGFMLFGSFVSRMRGLHEAVVREIRLLLRASEPSSGGDRQRTHPHRQGRLEVGGEVGGVVGRD